MKRNWFFYFEGEKAIGPLEKADVIERIQSKKLGPYQLMIRDGEEDWRPALAFDEFRLYLLNTATSREPSQSWVVLKRQDAGGHLAMETMGPFSSEEVRENIQAGKVEYTDYVWKDGMHQWRRISSLREFSPFEEAVDIPKPLVKMPPAPQIAKQVTKEEVLKKVEVVQRVIDPPKPEPKPREAVGPDLAAKPALPPLPPEPPPAAPTPKAAPAPKVSPVKTSVVKGSPAGVERRRLPRTAQISVRARTPSDVEMESPPPQKISTPSEDLDKTIVVDNQKAPKEALRPRAPKTEKPAAAPVAERPPKEERVKSGVNEDSSPDVTSKVSGLYNARITLPRNWLQITVILVLITLLYLKLFGGPDTVPLSQIPNLPSGEVPPPPPPPVEEQPEPVTQARPAPAPSVNEVEEPNMENDPNAPGDEAIRRVSPGQHAAARPEKKKKHEPTKLRARMLVQSDGGASLQVDTDADASQSVTIEIVSTGGQVLDRSHFYRRAKWQPGKPLSLGGELPSGYYKLKASVGNLTSEERFEIGTRVKGFGDRLKATRKQSAYEFWNERKRLYLATQQLAKLLGSRHPNEIDHIARFQPNSFAFSDQWAELKEICQLAKKMDPSAKARLDRLQSRIASLSVWK